MIWMVIVKEFLNKNKFIFIGLFILIILLICFLLFKKSIYFNNFNTSDEIVEVNSDYMPETITACYGNKFKCEKIDVSVQSDIDTSILGTYSVEYTASYKKHKKKISRNILVVDRSNPEITVASDTLSICPNTDEYDIEYSAYDNYDGDITSNINREIIDDNLVLSVSDSSGNRDSKTVSLIREDLSSPSISLKGNQSMYIALNSNFSEPGYSAYDNCDGDITDKVSISGSVNTSKAGNYTITYSVSDNLGNNTTITRSVNVYTPNNDGSKVVYLTFDDGPSQYTGELLSILAKYNVKATFFVTSINSNYAYYIKQAYEQGHSIALHTYTHNYSSVYASVDAYFNDLNAINEVVKNQTGNYSNLIRFPGGSSNTVSRKYTPGIMSQLSKMVEEKGFKYFDWNVSSGDASGTILSSEQYAQNIINGLGNSSYYIVLQHDTNINSIRAVGTVIEYGLAHGYSFKALSIDSPTVHHRVVN